MGLSRPYQYIFKSSFIALGMIGSILPSYADDGVTLGSLNETMVEPKIAEPKPEPKTDANLAKTLPTDEEKATPKLTREQAKQYLQQNPQLLEETLSVLIKNNDAKALAELLPLYSNYPQRDESLIDWANAIIAMDKGDTREAIRLYRKINAALPDIRSVRFQLAVALFQNKQYDAARSELIKLRSNDGLTKQDIDALNQYISFIDSQNRWNVNANFSYLNDKNLTNAPPEGTKANGLSLSSKHEKGEGIDYGISADKKFYLGSQYFTALHTNLDGKYYWDNKDFNEITGGAGLGFGYQDAKLEMELQPKYSQRWYGLGTSGDGKLHRHSETKGVGLSLNYWLTPQWSYQNYSEYNSTSYENPYTINDGKFSLISNTLMYLPSQRRYFYTGFDYLNKNAKEDDYSFDRKGLRLGWGEAWEYGISTRASIGYANKDYDAKSRYTQIQGKDKEYDANFSIWKRDLYLLGLTPRLSWNYHKVDSNDPFNEYSKNSVNLAFTKTF